MKQLLGALALCAAVSPAWAQAFIEVGIGQSKMDVDVPSATSTDDTDTSWALSGGYMFNPQFGAEFGYRELGEFSASRTAGSTTVRAVVEVDGFTLGLVGRFAVADKLAIVPRIGMYIWDAKGAGTINGVQTASLDDDGNDLYFGLGAEYSFTRQFFAGAHWARFDLDGDDVDVFELRIGLRF